MCDSAASLTWNSLLQARHMILGDRLALKIFFLGWQNKVICNHVFPARILSPRNSGHRGTSAEAMVAQNHAEGIVSRQAKRERHTRAVASTERDRAERQCEPSWSENQGTSQRLRCSAVIPSIKCHAFLRTHLENIHPTLLLWQSKSPHSSFP